MPGPPSSRIRLLGREDGYDRELQWEEGLGVPSGREGHGAGPKETIIKEVNMDKEVNFAGKGKHGHLQQFGDLSSMLALPAPHGTTLRLPASSMLLIYS